MSNRLDRNTLYQVTNIVLLSLPACSFNQGGSVIAAPGESPTDASKLGILDMPIAGKEYQSSTLVWELGRGGILQIRDRLADKMAKSTRSIGNKSHFQKN